MEKRKKQLIFGKRNYRAMLIGVFFIILGFILMSGGGSDNPNIFSDEIYNFTRIRIAPAIILIGFGIQVYAILKSSK